MKLRMGHTENPDFAETVEMCFGAGPPCLRGWAKTMKFLVNLFLCITQMGFCCIYFVFISQSLKQVGGFGVVRQRGTRYAPVKPVLKLLLNMFNKI